MTILLNKKTKSSTKFFWVFLVVLIFIGLGLDFFLQTLWSRHIREEQDSATTMQVGSIRARLEESIYANLLLVHGVAAHISITPNITAENFEALAKEIMRQPNILKILAAAPDLKINFVYPRQSNERVIGLNYRDLPNQWEQARLAMETGQLVLAGPIELVQGGFGLIGRAPVYVRHGADSKFWGLVSAVLDMNRLLTVVGITSNEIPLKLAIRGKDGLGAKGDVFFGEAALFNEDREPILATVRLPNGTWQMAALPKSGWRTTDNVSYLLHFAILGILLFVIFSFYWGRQKQIQLELIQKNLIRAQSIARLGSWEWSPEKCLLSLSQEVYSVLGLEPSGDEVGLNEFLSYFHPEDRIKVEKMMTVARIETVPSFSLEVRTIPSGGGERVITLLGEAVGDEGHGYFAGTVQDITEKKQAEETLRLSEDKFRSIFAYSNVGIVVADCRGKILEVNQTFQQLVGYTDEELKTKTFRDFTHENDRAEEELYFDQL
ncbi:MAG: PAS domain S-box protein, partial [Deltaproteobacteria bacterium]|nr:PAS domain S-box protein [Deltaproteobacteria bacterium]